MAVARLTASSDSLGEDVEQGIARSPLLEDLGSSLRSLPWPGPFRRGPSSLALARTETRGFFRLGVMTFDIRKTSIAAHANVRPLAERFGSRSGRRTIAESTSIRKRKAPPTTKSHK